MTVRWKWEIALLRSSQRLAMTFVYGLLALCLAMTFMNIATYTYLTLRRSS
jgi:hypothetical protein